MGKSDVRRLRLAIILAADHGQSSVDLGACTSTVLACRSSCGSREYVAGVPDVLHPGFNSCHLTNTSPIFARSERDVFDILR